MTEFERALLDLLPRLRRFARALTIDAADADDLCQIALERALKAEALWEQGSRLDSWMYRIMRNCWIDEVRARRRRSETFVAEEEGALVGEADDRRIEARVELGNVDRAMAALPPEQREVIALILVEGLAYKEAAELLDLPMGTITSRLVRGRQALLEMLGEAA
ncbi:MULTISPECIES: RNA polymerase sigma factor [unclassified Sphingomonas]|uniref:RNA polymerase sigma factor n=1 Tax=unclassified Sphingomonas TaxID=196159 RepID=UPI0006FCA934|nr:MULTISPECIES: RNA polymerase sigma factor [unclassified Sphingomonas]KQX17733.1 RNA polymerase subunit sigma-70 [Sphingomonas sp. Root1294]KQY70659.1 RNA polymerase subunit sigma-70 [Sphingomonas sp. Root50]KRB91849.1 RNA polymerase subunit sigma-70 [Sphingomonas sp. Root720]